MLWVWWYSYISRTDSLLDVFLLLLSAVLSEAEIELQEKLTQKFLVSGITFLAVPSLFLTFLLILPRCLEYVVFEWPLR